MNDNEQQQTKRGRPAKTIEETNKDNRRNEVALAILSGVIAGNNEITNKYELIRWCYEMADTFIEVGNETD